MDTAGRHQGMVRRGYADWSGGQVHYRRAGQGEAVVLLGGAPRSGSLFDPVAERLASAGFAAIAPDMPGFGMSDRMPADTTMAQLAAFLPALLDELGIARAHLFGLHSGGKLAAAAAAGWPDRFASLIVAGKSHSLGADQEQRNRTVRGVVEHRYFANGADQVDGPAALRGWAAEARNIAEMWWDDGLFQAADPPATMRAIEARVIDHLQGRRAVRGFYAANFDYDLTGDLSRCGIPVRVVEITSAAEDTSIGRQASALVAGVPRADIVELPQVDQPGYWLHAGIDAITNTITDFMRRNSIGGN